VCCWDFGRWNQVFHDYLGIRNLEGPESCEPGARWAQAGRERVLLIGTQFSNIYTRVDTPGTFRSTHCVCVFMTAVPITKMFAWGEGDSGGHVLRDGTRGEPGILTQGAPELRVGSTKPGIVSFTSPA